MKTTNIWNKVSNIFVIQINQHIWNEVLIKINQTVWNHVTEIKYEKGILNDSRTMHLRLKGENKEP